jgi:hypothetical protein
MSDVAILTYVAMAVAPAMLLLPARKSRRK